MAYACICHFFFVPLHALWYECMKIVIVIGLVLAAMLLLSVGVILRKDHSFRSQHIAENKRMKEDKIHCATSQDHETRRAQTKKIDIKNL